MSSTPEMTIEEALVSVLPHLPLLRGAIKTPENAKQAVIALFIDKETDSPRANALREYLREMRGFPGPPY